VSTPLPTPTPINYLTAALTLAARGWRVLPVIAGEKRPAIARWPELATTDARQIADWWIDEPDRNIGLATGAGSGFFVLDIDPKNGGSAALDELVNAHGKLPRTFTVRTGSGGTHYYFLVPDFEVTNSPGALKGTGIDVRGEGGQVVAPPSVTYAGSYALEVDAPLVEAPAWLLDLIKPKPLALVGGTSVDRIDAGDRPRIEAYVVRACERALETVAGARGGQRNQTLNDQVLALAGIAAHDQALVDKGSLYQAMHEACSANGYLADDGIASFAATFESAWKAGLERPRRDWPPVDKHAGLDFGTAPAPAGLLPVVNVSQRKHDELTDEVVRNLTASNDKDPKLFRHGSEVVRLDGPPVVTQALNLPTLTYFADKVMDFERSLPRGGTAVATLPKGVGETILSMSSSAFVPLERISLTPYFTRSGEYVSSYGYNAEARTFYSPSLSMTPLPVPEEPTPDEVQASLAFIRTEVLHDFFFVSEADRAHAIALMLLPFVRDLIDGPTPLHDIEAPTRGSGKGKLASVLLMPGVGAKPLGFTAPVGEEEWQKALFSHLRETPQALIIDNVNSKVTSAALCMALTEGEFSSRVLGVSQSARVPVRSVWVMTANNPRFSDEVARRTVRIRIDAQVERPENRGGWRHPYIEQWCAEHRAELVQACCTMVQGWVRAGMPELVSDRLLGSFERWHTVMGGLLDYLGVPGLLGNREDFLAAGDDEADAWGQLVQLMRLDITAEWSSAALAELVLEHGISIDLGRSENKALMMGRELSRQRDRWHDGHQISKRMLNGRTLWRLVGKPQL
jgi:hypothetical protein